MIFKTRYYRTSWNAEGRIMACPCSRLFFLLSLLSFDNQQVDGVSFNKMHPEYEVQPLLSVFFFLFPAPHTSRRSSTPT